MTTQPEALRLADALDAHQFDEPHAAATELRRLSAVEAELLAMRRVFSEAGCTFDVNYIRRLVRAEAQRDALLEALKMARLMLIAHGETHAKINAAIAKAKENT